jgi:hypothetical protein
MKMNTDKSARTPGPWTVEFGEAMYVRAPDGSHIAIMGQLTAHARRDANESAANAHLIAAAPELYEALRRISLAEADGLDCARDSMVLERAINIARATIAKAKGENEDAVHRGEE